MSEFYCNCSINEVTQHSPFEVMYGYQPFTLADRQLPLTDVTLDIVDRLTLFADIRHVVKQ